MRPILRRFCIKRLLIVAIVILLTFQIVVVILDFESRRPFDLRFIPTTGLNSCEQLFANTPVARFFLTPTYGRMREPFNQAVIAATEGLAVEGFSRQVKQQYLALHYLAAQRTARRVCETGFNMGHSAFNYLTASEDSIVHSFDMGVHPYSYVLAEYLRGKFPARLVVHFGSSARTVPQFIRENPEFRCDLMFVDGGHRYVDALADLENFARMANLKSNVVVFDDFPTDWGGELGAAWARMVEKGIVDEILRCRFAGSRGTRGFSVGRFVRRVSSDDQATSS